LTSSTTALITFTSNTVGSDFYHFLDGGAAAVNVNAAPGGWTATNLNPDPPLTDEGAGNEDGFGSFNQRFTLQTGANKEDTISFTLTDISGTWASAADVLVNNSSGFAVAAHIGVCSVAGIPCDAGDNTGFVTSSGLTPIPEPATWGMMLAGFFGTGALVRSRRRIAVNAG
jgi:hypothetical protein